MRKLLFWFLLAAIAVFSVLGVYELFQAEPLPQKFLNIKEACEWLLIMLSLLYCIVLQTENARLRKTLENTVSRDAVIP